MKFQIAGLTTFLVVTVSSTTECGSGHLEQSDYRGDIAATRTGRTCQRWDVQSPHKHSRTTEKYPDKGLEENYCRNPDGEDDGAWCYTTDGKKRWEYCNVPLCDPPPTYTECGSRMVKDSWVGQSDYRGTVANTHSGRTCQRWDSQTPRTHSDSPEDHPFSGLDDNYCRNPGGESERAWCYTTDGDKTWEFCDVPLCDTPSLPTECGNQWVDNSWVGQSDYRGTVAKTISGRTCQRWDSQSPQTHSRTYDNYPYSGLVENYCRNPDGEGQAWCYTTDDKKRWEYCDVPACDITGPSAPTFCYDYSNYIFELGTKECTETTLHRKIRDAYNALRKVDGASKCEGGLERELMALTRTTSVYEPYAVLQNLCDQALKKASNERAKSKWTTLEDKQIDLEEFWEGQGFLNDETGNFQQEENDFTKRGGYEKFIYIGDDSRQNDYLSTTKESHAGGKAIASFYSNEASSSILESPTSAFQEGSCSASNAAVCCWHRDRQYFDNNGNCNQNDCARANPADNTDLCWTEQNGTIFPYPGDDTEKDLHCHGFAWAKDDIAGDINSKAKWNNLFFVSLYDHLYQRGYADSITDDDLINGQQAMCGCVEDMNPVARADCTETVGRATYTAFQDGVGGQFVIRPREGSFSLEFQACQGYDYVEGFSPEDYDANPNAEELEDSNNDLSAFVFRLYLEGKIAENHVNTFEKTMIGYRDPSVNDGDTEREAVCKAAFEKEFPNTPYTE